MTQPTKYTDDKPHQLVYKLTDSRFREYPCHSLEQYHEELQAIVRGGAFTVFFTMAADVEGPKGRDYLLNLCQEAYPHLLDRCNDDPGRRIEWLATIAKLLYDAYYLECICGIEDYHRYAYYELEQRRHIAPELAHTLVRMMCAMCVEYGRGDAPHYYRLYLGRAYQAWEAKVAADAERDRLNAAMLQAEREAMFGGSYLTLEEIQAMEYGQGSSEEEDDL